MKITNTIFEDAFIIEPTVFGDHRGWFMETYSMKKIEEATKTEFIQDNHSYSAKKGVIRGLHFQNNPMAQTKLIRCTRGKIYDVIVDLRRESKTYLKWIKVELSEENKKQLLIPKGFAHGFVTLTDDVEVQYKVDNYYSKECDRSVRWNDPLFGIDWGIEDPQLSDKDLNAPFYKDSDVNF